MITLLCALLATAPIPPPDMVGVWELKAGATTIFRLNIVKASAGITALWERPEHGRFEDESFSHVTGPAILRQTQRIRAVEGDIELSFDDPTPDSSPDIFRLHRVDTDRIAVTYEGVGLEPFEFSRLRSKPTKLGPWDATRSYALPTITRPTNFEMSKLFDADQADRRESKIDCSVVGPADEKRRARTQQLLDSGALNSGDDFFNAAFIFQHGSEPDDFLKAHLLAMVALARGKPGAVWIASATLDRYLQASGKPQVLGTQFMTPKDAPVTQEPYNRALVSDAMRRALHVPPTSEQEEQLRQFKKQAAILKIAPK